MQIRGHHAERFWLTQEYRKCLTVQKLGLLPAGQASEVRWNTVPAHKEPSTQSRQSAGQREAWTLRLR